MSHLNYLSGCLSLVVAVTLLASSTFTYAVDLQPAINAFNERQYAQATSLFDAGVNDPATKNNALYYLGRVAFDQGDAEKSKQYLEQAIAVEPNSSEEYYWLGRSYGELAQHASIFKQASYATSARDNFLLAIDKDSKNIMAYRALFAFYMMAPSIVGGGVEHAEKTLIDIRRLSPLDADIKQLEVFAKKEEPEKGFAHAKYLVTTYPTSAEALVVAAQTFRNQKKFDEAMASFEAATKTPVTTYNRTLVENANYLFGETCLWADTRIDDGIVSIEKYLTLTADNKQVNKNWPRWTLAKLYHKKGNTEKYQGLRNQLDADFIKQDKVMKSEIKQMDKK